MSHASPQDTRVVCAIRDRMRIWSKIGGGADCTIGRQHPVNTRMAGFTIAASVVLTLATQPTRATDVPFSTANIIDGDFDGATCVCGADIHGET